MTSQPRLQRLCTPDDVPAGPLHVFAYGSLLWRPGFDYTSCRPARIYGFHRALRVWSVHHRGSEEQPGLVLGLDAGGSCRGCVLRVEAEQRLAVARYLWEREMVTSVYVPRLVRSYPDDGPPLVTLVFVLDRAHVQYAGALSAADAARHIAAARGHSGANPEYVRATVDGLTRIGVRDGTLEQIVQNLDRLDA